jgi:hypothetical protein
MRRDPASPCREGNTTQQNAFVRGTAVLVGGVLAAGSPAAAATVSPRGVIAYSSFDDASGLRLNGTAAVTAGALGLTSGAQNQAGAAWSRTTINLGRGFDTTFEMSMSGAVEHADGVAFVIQTDGPRAIGGLGGSIGYGGMTHSVAVEFDTYRNPDDLDNNHVAVVTAGRSDVPQPGAATSPIPLFGQRLHVRISYDPARKMMTVQVHGDGEQWAHVLSRPVDLTAALGTRRAYVGFTAGTGASVSSQDILTWSLDLPRFGNGVDR